MLLILQVILRMRDVTVSIFSKYIFLRSFFFYKIDENIRNIYNDLSIDSRRENDSYHVNHNNINK